MIDICKTIWRYRIVVLSVFIFLFVLDVVIGAIRLIAVELAVFLFGVVIGRMHPHPSQPVPQPVSPPIEPPRAIRRRVWARFKSSRV